MDAWMDGWMDGCTDGCMDGLMDGLICVCQLCLSFCLSIFLTVFMYACMHVRACVCLCIYISVCIPVYLGLNAFLYVTSMNGCRNRHGYMLSCVHYPDPLGIHPRQYQGAGDPLKGTLLNLTSGSLKRDLSDPALRLLRFDLVPLLWMAKQNADTAACLPRDSNIP